MNSYMENQYFEKVKNPQGERASETVSSQCDTPITTTSDHVQRRVRTQKFATAAYNYQYQRPEITSKATHIGGYLKDTRPKETDDVIAQRKTLTPIHSDTELCGVSGRFIDTAIFRDQNILLEILQNAEPNDSKGTWFGLEFYAKGKWRPVVGNIHKFNDEEIEQLRVLDNGKGYLPKDLVILGGGKRDDERAAGTFGSGMKIADRSALGKGIQMVRYSRNWRAVPRLVSSTTSAGEDHVVEYDVDYFEECLPGSVVEYRNLSKQMLESLRIIEQIYIPLDPKLADRVIADNEYGLILKNANCEGQITVNGRRYELMTPTTHPLLYEYDLHRCRIDDQNRHYASTDKVTENIQQIWSKLEQKEPFKKLFQAAKNDEIKHEHTMPGLTDPSSTFIEAAKEFYGISAFEKAYIIESNTSEQQKQQLKRSGYKAIEIGSNKESFIVETLEKLGTFRGLLLLDDVSETRYLSYSEENYEDATFAAAVCRAVVSAEAIGDRVTTQVIIEAPNGEKAISYSDLIKKKKYAKATPLRFIITVPGKILNFGIDEEAEYWERRKQQDQSLACFESFHHTAAASATKGFIESGTFDLELDHSWGKNLYIRNWKHREPKDLRIVIEVTNAQEAKEVRKLHEYSLRLNEDYEPLERTPHGDIVQASGSRIYEQGVVKNTFLGSMIFSYDFDTLVKGENREELVSKTVGETQKVEVAKTVIKHAEKKADFGYFLEYQADIKHPEVWKKAFEELYGEKAVLGNYVDGPHQELINEVQKESGFEVVKINSNLRFGLIKCGIKTLTEAVRVHKIQEYDPRPQEQALLRLAAIVDKVIAQKLPWRTKKLPPAKIRVVKSIENQFGQKLKSDLHGYSDPLQRDRTIFLDRKVVKASEISDLFMAIYIKMIEGYRGEMDNQKYHKFAMEVTHQLHRYATSFQFLDELRSKGLFRKAEDPEPIIEKILNASEEELNDAEQLKNESDELRMAAQDLKRKKKEARRAFYNNMLASLRKSTWRITKVMSATAVAVTLAVGASWGIMEGVDYLNEHAQQTGASTGAAKKRKKLTTAELKRRVGYQRPYNTKRLQAGVQEEVSNIPEYGSLSNNEYRRLEEGTFFSSPELKWGYWMRNGVFTQFDGTNMQYDENAPEFAPQSPENTETIAHLQVVGENQKFVQLRTRVGGYIDKKSIRLLKTDGTESMEFFLSPTGIEEYELTLNTDPKNVRAVRYHTVSPTAWLKQAKQLTNADFSKDSPEAFNYYTQVPQMNLASMKLNSRVFPELHNLQEFMDLIANLPPYKRIRNIRKLVRGMRYVINTRTANAWTKFYQGETPEKNFLEFAMNSPLLEEQGDGDCDVNNLTTTILLRMAKIPARMTEVVTQKGGRHGLTEAWLPKIGWVEMDTMGERVLTEKRNITFENEQTPPPEIPEDRLHKELMRQLELEQRGCIPYMQD